MVYLAQSVAQYTFFYIVSNIVIELNSIKDAIALRAAKRSN